MTSRTCVAQTATTAQPVTGCPACGWTNEIDFFEVDRIPVHVCMLGHSRREALDAPMGSIQLTYCTGCGLVRNRRFDPGLVSFEPGYEASLTHSETFRTFMEGLADRLIALHGLHGKTMVEVGCGSGYFLELVCGRGGNRGIGFDPTITIEQEQAVGTGHTRLVRDYYSERFADIRPDFLACLSVLEDIPDPVAFLRQLRDLMSTRPTAGVYLEVFNGMRAIDAGETWSIHYEQCNYFGRNSFARVVRSAGYEVLDASTCYGSGQYVYVDAHRGPDDRPSVDPGTSERAVPRRITSFSDSHRRTLDRWSARLDRWQREGRHVAVWGTGGKGISFLNALDTTEVVTCAVDINPDRQGMFTPGTGHPIVAPARLQDDRPDLVVITNRLYESEIRHQLAELRVTADVVLA